MKGVTRKWNLVIHLFSVLRHLKRHLCLQFKVKLMSTSPAQGDAHTAQLKEGQDALPGHFSWA